LMWLALTTFTAYHRVKRDATHLQRTCILLEACSLQYSATE